MLVSQSFLLMIDVKAYCARLRLTVDIGEEKDETYEIYLRSTQILKLTCVESCFARITLIVDIGEDQEETHMPHMQKY